MNMNDQHAPILLHEAGRGGTWPPRPWPRHGCASSSKYRRQARVSAEPSGDASSGLKVALLVGVEGSTHLLQVGRAQGCPRVPEEMITHPQLDFGGRAEAERGTLAVALRFTG